MTLLVAWSVLVSALIAIAAIAIERVASHFGAGRRFVWIGALVVATVAPVVIAIRPPPVVSEISASSSELAPTTTLSQPGVIASPASELLQTDFRLTASSAVDLTDEWFPRIWLVASCICFALLSRAVLRLRRERGRWTESESEIGRVLVADGAGPAVVGVLRPRIVVPDWALRADNATRELLLRHELEHVRAGDSRLLFGIAVLLALFPWNGALWWIARRLRLAIEIDCDRRVIRAIGDARAHAYGSMLLSVGERFASTTALPMSASLSEPGSHLEARIHAMTTPRRSRPVGASLPFVAIALVVLSTAAWTPKPAPLALGHQSSQKQPQESLPPVRLHQHDNIPPVAKAKRQPEPRPVEVKVPVVPQTIRAPKPLRGNPAPRYPDSLRFAGVNGYVIARFTVTARGTPDSSTIQIVDATHDQFASAVRASVPLWRFDSAGVVQNMVFQFTLTAPGQPDEPVSAPGVDMSRAVIITALGTARRSSPDLQQSPGIPNTPVGRVFKAWLDATNTGQAAQIDAFSRKYAPVESRQMLRDVQQESNGFDLLSVRESKELSLEFVVRERSSGLTHVGYAAVPADESRLASFRMLLVNGNRTADDPALLEHLRAMRP